MDSTNEQLLLSKNNIAFLRVFAERWQLLRTSPIIFNNFNTMTMNMKNIDMVTRPPFILVMAVISLLGTIIYLANTCVRTIAQVGEHYCQTHKHRHLILVIQYRPLMTSWRGFPIRNVEHFDSINRAGDAETQPASLKVRLR